jgi:glycolate oxidase
MPVQLPHNFVSSVREAVGSEYVLDNAPDSYAADALGIPSPPDLVAIPASTEEISAVARLCDANRIPLVVRGAGTG